MKALFVGLFFVVGSSAMAQDLNFNAYRKFLMQGNGTQKVAIQTTCTNAEGTVYRIGENGYDTCLSSLKNQQDQKQLTGKATKAPGAPAAGAGATIHFGN
jgi:hypothetical protein